MAKFRFHYLLLTSQVSSFSTDLLLSINLDLLLNNATASGQSRKGAL